MIYRPCKSKTKQSGWSLGWSIFSGFPTTYGQRLVQMDSLGHHCIFHMGHPPSPGHGKRREKVNLQFRNVFQTLSIGCQIKRSKLVESTFACGLCAHIFSTCCNCLYLRLFVLRAPLTKYLYFWRSRSQSIPSHMDRLWKTWKFVYM